MHRLPPVHRGGLHLPMRRVETFFIVIAIAFYAWFLTHYGPRQVLGYVRMAGWGLALTISLETLARVANTLGWRVTIEDYPPRLSFLELFGARIGGEAVDYVTPSAQLGGQFVMAVEVREKLRMPLGLATVVVASLAEAIGQIVFISIALVISLRMIPVAAHLYWAIVGGFALAVALAGGFFFVQMKRPFSHLWRAVARFDIARININENEIRDSAEEADAVLLDFYGRHRVRFVASCLCYAIAWSLGPLEIYILLRLLHQPATVQTALLVESLGLLIERATFLIPGKLVSQEGGKALILGMLGYPPGIGFAVGFLRRIKEMVWVLFGLMALMIHRMGAQQRGDIKGAAPAGRDSAIKMQRAQGEQSL
ncbi:MAG: lysylphosphatidylglycerol synthase domain-containing protein [Candidatus Binatus sp.]